MIKEYRKVATVKAEQFDGSEKMMNKYYIWSQDLDWPSCHVRYFLNTIGGPGKSLEIGDWIVTDFNGEHWAINNEVFQKTYAEVGLLYYIEKMQKENILKVLPVLESVSNDLSNSYGKDDSYNRIYIMESLKRKVDDCIEALNSGK